MGDLIAEDEIFKRLIYDGIETNYLISNYGRVWSENINGFMTMTTQYGRKRFFIQVNGKKHTIWLARAIALAFLGPGDGLEADHIDDDPTNDVLENIQWLSPSENKKKAHDSGQLNKYKGKRIGDNSNKHNYDEATIHVVCKMMENGFDPLTICNETGVCIPVINSIKSGKSWVHISSQYIIDNISRTKIRENRPKEIRDFIKEKLLENDSKKNRKR